MKILIMGLPGSGKTHLASRLKEHLGCAWYNADEIRSMANDWEFSEEARLRQAFRMCTIADVERKFDRTVICDFVCPTKATRDIFGANYTIWVNTIEAGRFEDTNRVFEPPVDVDMEITYYMTDEEIEQFAKTLI